MGDSIFNLGTISWDLCEESEYYYFTTKNSVKSDLDISITIKKGNKTESFDEYERYKPGCLLEELFGEIEKIERETQELNWKTEKKKKLKPIEIQENKKESKRIPKPIPIERWKKSTVDLERLD